MKLQAHGFVFDHQVAAARMLNSITNMGKKTKKKPTVAPPPPPLTSGQRVRYQGLEGFVSQVKGDAYEVALDGGRVVQATRSDLEPIHRWLSTKQPSHKLSSTRSSTELDYRGTNFEDFPDEALPLIEVSDDKEVLKVNEDCLLYTSPSPRDRTRYRMPSSA